MTTHCWTLVAVRLLGTLKTARVAVSANSRAPRRSAIISSVVFLSLFVLGNARSSYASPLVDQTPLDPTCIPMFALSLPVFGPAGSVPRVDAAGHPYLTVTMKEINQAVLPQSGPNLCGMKFRKTRVWAYESTDSRTGEVLGPANWPAVTLVAMRGTPTRVKYINQLPSFNPSYPWGPGLVEGVLPIDQTIHWADPLHSMGHSIERALSKGSSMPSSEGDTLPQYIGPIPTTVHLHGGEIPAAYDGNPDSWFTPDGLKGPGYQSAGNPKPGEAIYEYPNSQEAGTLWFHDHALGITRINVYAGLAGFYFLQDPAREPKGYPGGPYEIEMAIQDRMFDTKSQLYFPQQQKMADHPYWGVYFEGNVATVNGAAFPYLNVEPRRYRFHLLNGSNHRGYVLSFGSALVYQIGADDNYFDKPVPLSTVTISPGERADIIVDFSNSAGQNITVGNKGSHVQIPLVSIMQFRVASRSKAPETSCDPAHPLASIGVCARKDPFVRLTDGKGNLLPGVKVDKVRQMIFYDYVGPVITPPDGSEAYPSTIKEFVNNTDWNGLESPSIAHDFPSDGISELPRVGSVEEWQILYLSDMQGGHPLHLHLTQFQVLNRETLTTDALARYMNDWNYAFGTNKWVPPPAGCSKHTFCPDYGPPLDYKKPNDDGALGGNIAFSGYTDPKNIMLPNGGEAGWKDTADVTSGQIIRILVRWTPSDVAMIANRSYAGKNFYEFDPTQGTYVWHCHVIDHEDNEMMRPYRVTW
jgi:spore coat protein A, manganese oxidase